MMYTVMMKKISFKLFTLLLLTGCALSPGMHMSDREGSEVYIETIKKKIKIEKLEDNLETSSQDFTYRIGNGDQVAITVWGLPEVFPLTNISADQNLRRVDSNGNIYFPYAGTIKASAKTQNELRVILTSKLSEYFKDPQLDVSIARFNSQKAYLLGEVVKPGKINLTDIHLSLSDALGEVNGLNNNTSDGAKVFIIRQGVNGQDPRIILADLSSPSGFLNSNQFFIQDNDIIYVNPKGTTRWNRVISQFFPFSSFLNSIDNLTND